MRAFATGIGGYDYAGKSRKALTKVSQKVWETTKRLSRKTAALTVAFLKNPLIVKEWYSDIREAVRHFVQWGVTGFRVFGADMRASFFLLKRVVRGYPLKVRERRLLVRTTSDCLKLIPFSFFIIVPFAELALPFVLRLFPNLLPSSFFQQKYDNATLARKLKAKEEMADFWQQVVHQRTKEISQSTHHEYHDRAQELQDFQEKLLEGKEYPSLKEILRFSRLFQEELNLQNMNTGQLSAMSKMLGLPQTKSWWPGHLEVQLRHHITQLRREDRDLLWEGIDNLTEAELIEACKIRNIRFHDVTEQEMRRDLARWLELSANHREIPTSLLLWIQSFYLRGQTGAHSEAIINELQIKVEPERAQESEPKEAFSSMAERQKAYSESAQQKLEELRMEIDEVLQESQLTQVVAGEAAAGDLKARVEAAAEHSGEWGAVLREEQKEKQRMLDRAKQLEQTLRLYRDVVARQKMQLDQQLRFLAAMRDNKPTQNKDADVILLDQRVRLMEMVGSFEKSTQEIESLLTAAEPPDTDHTFGGQLWVRHTPEEPAPAAAAAPPAPAPEQPAPVVASEPLPPVEAAAGSPASWDDLDAAAALGLADRTGVPPTGKRQGTARPEAVP